MDKDTILDRIGSMNFPDPGGVIIVGGTALALLGLRPANDIDILLSWRNWQYVKTLPTWKEVVSYGRRHMVSEDGLFDAWRWWFDVQASRRISFEEIAAHCIPTPEGYLLPRIEYQVVMKQQLGRAKDTEDIRLLKSLQKT